MLLLRSPLSTAVVLLSLTLVAACDVGAVGGPGGGGNGPDASGGGGGTDAPGAALCVDRGQIGVPHDHGGVAGVTHAGEGCLTGTGCHGPGGAGGAFAAAGTVYKADGVTPNGGAAIRVKFGATTVKMFADSAGNFFTQTPITFPAKTDSTACPDVTAMSGQIVAGGGGNCNGGSACHQKQNPGQGVIKFQ